MPEFDPYEGKTFTVPAAVLFPALDTLRLAHIFALKDSHPDSPMLPPDFNPYKWTDELAWAEESIINYRALLDAMIADDEARKATDG